MALHAFAQDGKEEFAVIEAKTMPDVVLTYCEKGKKPCYNGNARYGCVSDKLNEKQFKKACEKQAEEYKKFTTSCYVKSQGQVFLLGLTTNQEGCDELTSAWDKVWTSPDYVLLQKQFSSPDLRIAFFQNNLMRKSTKRDVAITSKQIKLSKRGNKYKENDSSITSIITNNLNEYIADSNDRNCGPGILPGIDKIPVLNQNKQGTCYSHVAVSMLDYVRRFKINNVPPTYGSPLMAAIDYKLGFLEEENDQCNDPFISGNACATFNSHIKKGFCKSDQIEKAILKSFDAKKTDKNTNWYMNWSKEKINLDFDMSDIKPNDDILQYLYVVGILFEQKKWSDLKVIWENTNQASSENVCIEKQLPLTEFMNWEKITKSSSMDDFYVNYFNSLCKREPVAVMVNCYEEKVPKASTVDEWLSEGYPLGIRYCSTVLGNRNYKSPTKPIEDDKSCNNHASMIVGTSKDSQGRCTYVVRNSWGKGCLNYDKDYDCKDGNVYIPKNIILNQTYKIQRLSVEE